MNKGWLLDVYPSEEGMVVWIKTRGGREIRLIDDYIPSLYVYAREEEFKELERELEDSESVKEITYEEKRVRLGDIDKSKVMRIDVTSISRFPHFARKIVRLGEYRKYHLFNVDIPHARMYLYQRDLFPLAKLSFSAGQKILFDLQDSVESCDYELPPLKSMWVEVEPDRKGFLPSFEDPIASISISCNGDEGTISEGSEAEKLLSLVEAVKEEDPDMILTRGGDSWVIQYLAKRAEANEVIDEMMLGREAEPIRATKRRGRPYFSYGKVYYKPPAHILLGRIHVDVDNSFIYGECGLEGLFELSRLTKLPLHEMARSSIGSAMSSIQIYTALKRGVLIPWMKREPEEFKTALKLLEADRGGFIFEPRVGLHEFVGEVDFASFYPAMMEKYNISPETVLCSCCPDSRVGVPELGYNICERRRGLIPEVIELVLGKRNEYRRRMREAKERDLRDVYRMRQSALKWILVTCFGYLGYRNARFGRIEAHESVTAFARENLLRAVEIAEKNGFEVIHGIVDSLWLKRGNASESDFISLCEEIKSRIGLPISLEGVYGWIVFLPSKVRPPLPVLNRFYGVFEGGAVKARGIMMRRGDMPAFIRRAQEEMLQKVSRARRSVDFKEKIPEAIEVLRRYKNILVNLGAKSEDLAFYRQLSRHPLAYEVDAHTAIAAKQMLRAGVELRAGQTVAYVITDAGARNPDLRVKALPLLGERKRYDVRKYIDLLLEACEELFGLFGYTKERIAEILGGVEQEKFTWQPGEGHD